MDKKNKILLIDDEQDLLEAVKIRLEASGYEVIYAGDGISGLEKAKRENPNLIILDLMLPKMDGYKVCSILKRDAKYTNIPIIIFTARAQKSDIEMSKEAGADAHIIKPFASEVLLNKIKELIKN